MKRMIFEVKGGKTTLRRLWDRLSSFVVYTSTVILLYMIKDNKYNLIFIIVESLVVIYFLYELYSKKNRNVFKIEINSEMKNVKVCFYQFVFYQFDEVILFDSLSVEYKYKRLMRGVYPKTLEIRRNNTLVVEIKQKYNFGWNNKEIDEIYLELTKIISK